eukprot:CAMPEP_0174352134 /NCGR_PEP_ID=MMETSP0811_2-20130205/9685_1 /TAXON_ID=73025 ORGANISM="Eutreptiella gymnastica-like, Strain CCMP1594" /NCGR_SAMPLE_ID=MMETSP0811_2 /ASSEMBLY_ACC=CAM_ASM_000667 /LENGTH=377 /DNA_ID=CAMNT_0015482015 /DNA_START=88 /DNA_END=1221 /DNA_ORIENTATION=+
MSRQAPSCYSQLLERCAAAPASQRCTGEPCLSDVNGVGATKVDRVVIVAVSTIIVVCTAVGGFLWSSIGVAFVQAHATPKPLAGIALTHRQISVAPPSVHVRQEPLSLHGRAGRSGSRRWATPTYAPDKAAGPTLEGLEGLKNRHDIEALKGRIIDFAEEKGVKFTDMDLFRFLKSCAFDIGAAEQRVVEYIEWRKKSPQYGVKDVDSITPADVTRERQTGKGYVLPMLRPSGTPVIVYHARLHRPKDPGYNADESLRYIIYTMEQAIARMPPGISKLWFVVDLKDISLSNVDYDFIKRFVKVLLFRYPERLGGAVLINAPMFFNACWPLIKKLLTPETQQKFIFAKTPKELAEFIPLDILPSCVGGTSSFTFLPDV